MSINLTTGPVFCDWFNTFAGSKEEQTLQLYAPGYMTDIDADDLNFEQSTTNETPTVSLDR